MTEPFHGAILAWVAGSAVWGGAGQRPPQPWGSTRPRLDSCDAGRQFQATHSCLTLAQSAAVWPVGRAACLGLAGTWSSSLQPLGLGTGQPAGLVAQGAEEELGLGGRWEGPAAGSQGTWSRLQVEVWGDLGVEPGPTLVGSLGGCFGPGARTCLGWVGSAQGAN